jgi:hypothetical protein
MRRKKRNQLKALPCSEIFLYHFFGVSALGNNDDN